MFRQAISTSSRALRTSTRVYAPRTVARSQFTPAQSLARSQLHSSRWYSESADAKKEGEDAPTKEADTPATAEAELKKKLEVKEKEASDWKDKFMRSVADFRNLQDRAARDQKSARDFAIQKFAKDLVDSVDNLDRALTMGQDKIKALEGSDQKNDDLASFYEGVKMTEGLMLSTLTKHGLERFDPEGEKFNANEHEATFMAPMPGKDDNSVFHVQQKGFKLNGRVLRAAKVGVVKNA